MRGLYRKYILSTSVKYYHYYLIRQCKLGLFHGMDCYRAYARSREFSGGSRYSLQAEGRDRAGTLGAQGR